MKELSDEYLQKMLENGLPVKHNPDAELYQQVFKQLEQEPRLQVEDLSTQVIQKIQHHHEWGGFFKSLMIAAGILLLGTAVLVIGVGLVDVQLINKFLNVIVTYKWLILLLLGLLVVIEVLDKQWAIKWYNIK
ncbi:hypothetical protein HH214_11730 [Mucilaginibacter robiniae]|uniref:Uncharacterized protein n=1 Tax=Mucilaginibacter robiniae TaxID=2728022 RepID=A0A7L5E258_9SPHI|nr:hypothetical protein [Mucilaginibacter robiniae]QJD96497.1 hypothetical protein HH214_11730 [Mucilaginibacter robiniae]